ncbi:hypothetical protein BDZ89DRAFT_1069233 [Hymenopellis radicata]|nr:hypothetical protein BDZ89DRAFT_1069233 [Hymenopellis radicata]
MSSKASLPDFCLPLANNYSDLFVSSLSSPGSPSRCATFYVQCIHAFCGPGAHSHLRATRHDVFTSAMRFVTHSRTEAELSALERRIPICKCGDLAQNHIHMMGRVNSAPWPPTLQGIFEAFATLIVSCFSSDIRNPQPKIITLDKARKRSNKAEQRGQKPLWPEKTHDLFVNSPETTLFVIWRLFYRFRSRPLLNALNVLIHISESTLSSLFPKMPAFPGQLMNYFEEEVTKLRTEKENQVLPLATVVILLRLSTQIPLGTGDFNAYLFWQPRAHNILPNAHQSPLCRRAALLSVLTNVGSSFVGVFKGDLSQTLSQYSPQFRQLSSLKNVPQFTGNAFNHIQSAASSDRCQNPDCAETHSTQNRRFSACSGCSIICYCSPECQKAAWKHADAPHKRLCALLQDFKKKVGMTGQELKAQYTEEETAGIIIRSGVTTEEAEDICKTIADLVMWRDMGFLMRVA